MVVTEGYRLFVGDLRTGKITADLPPASLSWGLRLNDAGPVEATVQSMSAEAAPLNLRANTAPLKQFIGVAYNGVVLEAGPIWKRALKPEDGALTITGAGMWSLLDKRKALPWVALRNGMRVQDVSLDLVNMTLGTIAREMVRTAIQDNLDGGLPIVLPPFLSGTHERHYPGYQLEWVGDLLRRLPEVKNGPDLELRPRYVEGDRTRIEWVFNTGTEDQPLLVQQGDDLLWDGSVQESGVVGFGVVEDGTDLASKVYVPGAGQERDMRIAGGYSDKLLKAGYVYTERDTANKNIEDQALLQGYADQLLEDSLSPWTTYSISVRTDTDPTLGTYWPGYMAQLVTPADHPIMPPGKHRIRVMALDGDHTANVRLAIAPVLGDTGDAIGDGTTVAQPNLTPALYPGLNTFPGPNTYPSGG